MKLIDFLGREFLEMNYDTITYQLEEQGITEIDYLKYLIDAYSSKITNYQKEYEKLNEQQKDDLTYYLSELENLKFKKKLLLKVDKKKGPKNSGALLIDGKKPNIEERYYIACEVFGIDKIILSKNIAQSDKDDLLAHLMGIGKQAARELNNGTYSKRTSELRVKILDDYIRNLNK